MRSSHSAKHTHSMKRTQALTSGSISSAIFRFAMPLFLGQLLQQFYNMADAWVIGNFASNNAFAAVSSGGNLTFLIIGFFSGIGIGGGVVISRYFGAQDKANIQKAIHTDVFFGLVASVIATVVGLLIVPKLLVWMKTPTEVLPYSLQYFRIYFGGVTTIVLYNVCMSIMQAQGDSLRPLYYLAISSAANVVLDLLFVAVIPWGVTGAAVATVLAQGLSVVLCLRRMCREPEEHLRLNFRLVRWDKDMMARIIRQGLPTGVQNAVISLGNVVIQSNVNSFGAYAMSGLGAYSKVEGFAFLSVTAMSMTLPTFVSQNLGAGNVERAKKGAIFGTLSAMAAAELTGVLMYIFIPQLLSLFISDPEAIAYGIIHARIDTLFYCMLALAHCSAGILRGCGKSAVPMVVMLGCWCVLRSIYVTVILKFIHEFRMISWAYPLTWTVSCILFVCYISHLNWRKAAQRL